MSGNDCGMAQDRTTIGPAPVYLPVSLFRNRWTFDGRLDGRLFDARLLRVVVMATEGAAEFNLLSPSMEKRALPSAMKVFKPAKDSMISIDRSVIEVL